MEYYTHLLEGKLLEMAEVGRFDEYKLLVYGSEGPVPHFHFESIKGKKKGCIRLDKPEYFFHGKYQDRLNSKEVKNLIAFLTAPHRAFGDVGITNWQVICIYWNDDNTKYQISDKAPMPDYSKLKEE